MDCGRVFLSFSLHAHISASPSYICHRRNLTHAFSPFTRGNCCCLLLSGLQGSISWFSHASLTVLGLVLLDIRGGVFQQFCPFTSGCRSLLCVSSGSWAKFIFYPAVAGSFFFCPPFKGNGSLPGPLLACPKFMAFASCEGRGHVGGGFHAFVPPTGSLSGLLPCPQCIL